MDRRDFIKNLGLVAGTGYTWTQACRNESASKPRLFPTTRVAVVHADGVRDKKGQVRPEIKGLLAQGIKLALNSKDAVSGLKSIVGPKDVVGVKLNCLAGRPLSPTLLLSAALTDLLHQAGVQKNRIIFFEREERDLRKAGFPVRTRGSGPLFLGHNSPACGYEPDVEISGEVGSCLSCILTQRISVLINLGVLKDHNLAGVSVSTKNLYGLIHNPNKYHDSNCNPYLADVLAFPAVQKKLKLNIIDATTAQCEGGPGYVGLYAWTENSLLVSTDSLATDVVGWQIIERRRQKTGLPTLAQAGRSPTWIQTASERNLGLADPQRIQILTWSA
jgi:uncharacterized protein (DUF362 family)